MTYRQRVFGQKKSPRIKGVSDKFSRTYNGHVYHSKTEAQRAVELDMLLTTIIIEKWERQVKVKLGPDIHTIIDFKVTYPPSDNYPRRVRYQEVKGFETERFKLVRRLWKKYGPAPLHIMKRSGRSSWKTEIIDGAPAPRTAGRATATTARGSHPQEKKPGKKKIAKKKKTPTKKSIKKNTIKKKRKVKIGL